MRILPWNLVADEFGKGQYYRHRYGKRAIPEWWTWSPGNVWDFIAGNMYADLKKERHFRIRNDKEREKQSRFTFAIMHLKAKDQRRQERRETLAALRKKAKKLLQ